MKYKLGEKHSIFELYRVVSLKDFGDVELGDVGGWIESEKNLSQDGDCWVYDKAWVYGNALVSENALVYDNARVYGNARVHGNALVYGHAHFYGNSLAYGYAQVCGDELISGNTLVTGFARIYEAGEPTQNSKPEVSELVEVTRRLLKMCKRQLDFNDDGDEYAFDRVEKTLAKWEGKQ